MFYKKVSDYCKSNGMPISEFEKRCGLGNGTVGGWKDNKSKPSIQTLSKMERYTGIPIAKWLEPTVPATEIAG